MDYMGTKAAAELWGYSPSTITAMCRAHLIDGAQQDAKGSPWRIPVDALNPKDVQKSKKKEKQK